MKKNTPILSVIYLLLFFVQFGTMNTFAQTPAWQWAKGVGGLGNDVASSVATDASGNIYVAGNFGSSSITFGTTTYNNAGISDVYLVKYDASGNVLWAESAGGTKDDIAYSVTTDASGNVYVAGYFYSPTLTFGTTTLTNAGGYDIFIAKYDSSGNVLWAKRMGGAGNDVGYAVATDGSGNVYLTGSFSSTTVVFGSTSLPNSGGYDIFLTKFDSGGTTLWAKKAGDNGGDNALSIALDASGNSYVTGYFNSATLSFGATTLTNTGGDDVFLAKYDPSGNPLWAKSSTGSGSDGSFSVATDPSGNAYIAGAFHSSILTVGSTALNIAGGYDLFLAKYDANGNALWAKGAGGLQDDVASSVATDAFGNVYLAGHFYSDTIKFGSDNLNNAGIADIFLAKYDSGGGILWAEGIGGSGADLGNSVTTHNSGDVYLAGNFGSPSFSFGSHILTNTDNSGNTSDIFVAAMMDVTGVLENAFGTKDISVYPNPSVGKIQIQSNKVELETLEIYNAIGEKVYSEKINNPHYFNLDLEGPNGIYFLQFKTKEGILSKKIIINK